MVAILGINLDEVLFQSCCGRLLYLCRDVVLLADGVDDGVVDPTGGDAMAPGLGLATVMLS